MKKMLTLIAIAMLLGVFCQSAIAAELSGSASFEVKSKYVLGNGVELYGDPLTRTGFCLDLPKRMYFGFAAYRGFKGGGNTSEEYDFNIGIRNSFGIIDIDSGIYYYDLNLPSGTDMLQPYVKLSRKVENFTPYIQVDIYAPTDEMVRDSKVRIRPGISHSFFGWGTKISQCLNLFYEAKNNAPNPFGVHHAINFAWEMRKSLFLNISNEIFLPISDETDFQTVQGVGLSWKF